MNRGMAKAERLREMERLYYLKAYSDQEMADLLGTDRTTVFRNRTELEAETPFLKDEHGRWKIDRTRYLSEIRVNANEALILYLAARRLSQQTRMAQPITASALEKLALALKQPMTTKLADAAQVILTQKANPEKVKILETIAQGWVEKVKVRIRYQGLSARQAMTHWVSPYLLEPSPWSDSTYLIAFSDVFEDVATFKIERIEQATLGMSGDTYTIPDNFDEKKLLKHAWGIWSREGEPKIVKLKFAPGNATRRLKESVWHPLETVTDSDKGGCVWEAPIAEWQEMLPWVRGWGADCEVLEPERLRNALKQEAQELAELYQAVETKARQWVYYAHSRKDEDKAQWQLLKDHLTNTADLADKFGADAGISELARIAALMHDIGKYSKEFQKRLDGSGAKVDHATAGAKEIRILFNQDQNQKLLADMLAYCIAGHHTGLPDYGDVTDVENDGTLLARVEKKPLKDYSTYKTEITSADLALPARLKIRPHKKHPGFSFAFLTRMIFSALVDADFQDTETYMNQGEKPRGGYARMEDLCEIFNLAMQKFNDPQSELNKKRTETLLVCQERAAVAQGFFTLTIPTGGGKTLASMAFALNHAVKHGLKRVVYVIPFTSIIEQNAAVFKAYLGDNNVLEHHSNFDWKKGNSNPEAADDETKDALDKLKLASENWDIPIVVTTNVQFFESLFANKSSRCRKLHNLAKSVIIFDEAQMLPREYLDPCMLAVKELVTNYGASAVFCTATQPVLDRRLPEANFTELAPDPQALFDFYKRVQITHLGRTPDTDLIEKIQAHPQALCIVNTRKHAKGLFDQLEGEGSFHLSTLMCPTHRKEVLAEVRERLKTGQPCRVISTQVMEAGIDVDFPVGFRALAGLDSILQAAGRVNREMKSKVSDMYVFDPETPFIKKTPQFIEQGATVAEIVLREFPGHPDSQAAIEHYFNFLYGLQPKTAFDAKNILGYFDKGIDAFDFDFKTAAEHFRMIDNNTAAVVIPYNEEARSLLKQARYHPFPYTFARQLQMYTVNIYENEFEKLQSKGVIETINETYETLTTNSMQAFYSEKTGLILPIDAGGDALFFD